MRAEVQSKKHAEYAVQFVHAGESLAVFDQTDKAGPCQGQHPQFSDMTSAPKPVHMVTVGSGHEEHKICSSDILILN
jgi:hypothetical protein